MRTADPHAPTKEKLIESAVALFMEKGYTATSVDEICAKAGATKGSFFHFFKGKDELGKTAMRVFADRQMAMMLGAGFRGAEDPSARALGWIDMAIRRFEDPSQGLGCVLASLTQELADTREDFKKVSAECFEMWNRTVEEDFAAALKGRKGPRHDARKLAVMFLSIAQGSLLLVKATGNSSIGADNMRHFRAYVESLLAEKPR